MNRKNNNRRNRNDLYQKKDSQLDHNLKKMHEMLDKAEKFEYNNQAEASLYFKLYKSMGECLINYNKMDQNTLNSQTPVYENLWNKFLEIAENQLKDHIDFFCSKNGQVLIFEIIKYEMKNIGKINSESDEFRKFTTLQEEREKNIKKLYNTINNLYTVKKCSVTGNIRKIAANLVCYLGEQKQWELKASSKEEQIQMAAKYYLMAVNLYPFEGRFFYLLSTCSHILRDLFSTFYWAVLGQHSNSTFDFHDDLQQLLIEIEEESNKIIKETTYSNENLNMPLSHQIRITFKNFALGIINIYGKVLNKISIDTLRIDSSNSLNNLWKFLQNQQKSDEDILAFKQLNQSCVIMNTCHFLAEKYDEPLTPDFINFQKIECDTLRETVLSLSSMICIIFETTLGIKNLVLYLETIRPLVIYLKDKKYFIAAIMYKQKKFCEMLPQIIIRIQEKIMMVQKEQYENELLNSENGFDEFQEQINLIAEGFNGILEDELVAINFEPFTNHYKGLDFEKVIPKENQIHLILHDSLKFFNLMRNIFNENQEFISTMNKEEIQKKQNFGSDLGTSHGNPLHNDLDKEIELYVNQSESNIYLKAFQIGSQIQDRTKTTVVVDGRNVAVRYGETICPNNPQFYTKGILLAVKFFHELGHPVMVILPDYCYNSAEVQKRRMGKLSIGDEKTLPDDCQSQIELKNQHFACGVPNWDYDDSYILEYARTVSGYIVTNDRFKDYLDKFAYNDHKQRNEAKRWLQNNCISFSFIGKTFMPNPDFIKDHNIK